MKNLKEILKNDKEVWFVLKDNQKKDFLNWAKNNGLVWINKNQIDVEKDDCYYHMAVNNSKKEIANINAHCFFTEKEKPKIVYFDKVYEDVELNNMNKYSYSGNVKTSIITSESVNIGHPDKTCDTIADAFLDEALKQDKASQMAVECAIKNDKIFIYGEATTKAKIDYERIAKEVLKDIGYKCDFKVIKEISEQSPDINQAVIKTQLCANDQGIIYGYATNETKEYMPLPILLAHKLMQRYDQFRRKTDNFYADAKSQVSVEYVSDKPKHITTILISVSHSDKLSLEEIKKTIKKEVIDVVLKDYTNMVNENTNYIINPSGKFTIWGSFGDSGCVGRKIVVDTYGGVGKVGGGCFSSKNATKVDRSGAYYARYVAKNIVANGYADKCEIQVSYGIGLAKPISLNIDTFGTEKVALSEIYNYVNNNYDFSPQNIIDELGLLKPIYKNTACFGHFGRDEFPWEKVNVNK